MLSPQKDKTPIRMSLATSADQGFQSGGVECLSSVNGTFSASIRQPAAPEKGSLLGIYTGTPASLVPQGFRPSGPDRAKSQEIRRERFRLQAVVRRFFPSSRTSACMRMKVPDAVVGLHRHRDTGRAFYSGLAVCGSVWICPVCAAKISERRRVELAAGIEAAKAKGWQVHLLTLTVPHGLGDDLPDMLARMTKAWRRMTDNRDGKAVRAAVGLQGTVRAWEVTDGRNGFHPHYHALLFLDSSLTPEQVQAMYSPLWRRHCVAVGLPEPSEEHGCRVDGGERAAQYVGKWGLDYEVTKGHIKRATKPGGMSPFDMLRAWADSRDQRAVERFRLFADAFHGKRQLYWSNGLRDALGLDQEATDEELAQASTERASLLAEIEDDEWFALRRFGLDLDLLDLAENHPERVRPFLDGVRVMIRDGCLDLFPPGS